MAINALITGRIRGAVTLKEAINGRKYARFKLSTIDKIGNSSLVSCTTFSVKALNIVGPMVDGDSVCVSGEASLNTWADKLTGAPCHGLDVMVEVAMTAYHLASKRKAHAEGFSTEAVALESPS